jgi:hypothetical protein
MRSLSRSLGVCLSKDVSRRSLRILELRSPSAYRRFSSGVSTINGLTFAGLRNLSILEFHELCISYFFVPGSSDTIVNVQLINTSSSFTFSPSWGAFATCIVISRLDLPVAYVTRPDNCKSHISVRGEWMVMRSQLAVTVVTSSPVCLSVCILRPIGFLCRYWGLHAMIPESASRSMKIVPRRMCPEELRYVSRSHGSRAKGSTTE